MFQKNKNIYPLTDPSSTRKAFPSHSYTHRQAIAQERSNQPQRKRRQATTSNEKGSSVLTCPSIGQNLNLTF